MAKQKEAQRAIVTVVGKDTVGIVAAVTNLLASLKINILNIEQTVMEDIFAMILLVDLQKSNLNVAELADKLNRLSQEIKQQIHVHDEEIIKAMHRI